MIRAGFKKVKQEGGTFVVATFFNPDTGESYSACVRDYDYSDCSRDDDEAYNAPIDEQARRLYLRSIGVIQPGDTVRVVKGRKIPVGTVAVVDRTAWWHDRFGRPQTLYAYFTDGRKTSVENCQIVE